MYCLTFLLLLPFISCSNLNFNFNNFSIEFVPLFNDVSIFQGNVNFINVNNFTFTTDLIAVNFPNGINNNIKIAKMDKFEKIETPCLGISIELTFNDSSNLIMQLCFYDSMETQILETFNIYLV